MKKIVLSLFVICFCINNICYANCDVDPVTQTECFCERLNLENSELGKACANNLKQMSYNENILDPKKDIKRINKQLKALERQRKIEEYNRKVQEDAAAIRRMNAQTIHVHVDNLPMYRY